MSRSIADVAHPHWWAGANEVELAPAARHFDCDLPMVRRTDAERARDALVRHPVWSHAGLPDGTSAQSLDQRAAHAHGGVR